MKDHTIRRVVNDLRDTAVKFHATQQLRERLRSCIEPLITAAAPDALPDVPYSSLEQRFFQGLNRGNRHLILQVLGGHTDALMAEVRNHSDERRLFKHLFKAAPARPAEIKHSASCLSVGGGPSDDDCICGMHQAQLDALHPPTYTKHGYILQAAGGHQTWLKGDPATGMGRYGKIIQLYKKEPPCLP